MSSGASIISITCYYYDAGPGRVYILDRDMNSGEWKQQLVADYRDNLLDICWCESDPNVLTTAAGDGFVQVWNLSSKFPKVGNIIMHVFEDANLSDLSKLRFRSMSSKDTK